MSDKERINNIRLAKGKVKAVAYARFSSANQREESIEAQMEAIEKYAKMNNIEIIRKYADRAKSGTDTDNRVEFQKMLKSAKLKDFDFVIVHKVDRFARNIIQAYDTIGKLRNYEIDILSATGETDNEFIMGIKMLMADEYVKNLAQEVRKGLNINAEKGMFNGGVPPLGYDIDNSQHYVINEAEAEIVRSIFNMIAENNSYKAVIEMLNKCGYKTKHGNMFGKNSIHDLLRNEKYCGTYTYNKHVAAYTNGEKKVNNGHGYRDKKEIIKIEDKIPPIISKELFYKVKSIMDSREGIRCQRGKNHTYLLTGKIFCGECGSHYSGFSTRNKYKRLEVKYRCQGRKQKSSSFCKNISVEANKIENVILKELEKVIFDKSMVGLIYEKYSGMFTEQTAFHDAELKQTRKELEDIEKRMRKLMDLIETTGNADLIAQYDARKGEKETLKAKIQELSNKQIPGSVSKSDIRKYLKTAQKLFETKSLEEMQQLINMFVNRVTVYKDHFQIDLNYMEITKSVQAKRGIKKQTAKTGNLY